MPVLTKEERIGTTLEDKYAIVRVLGEGGMGVVYEGVHALTRRRVAIKIMHVRYADDDVMLRRFLREARAAASLEHRNVVGVLDMGRTSDGTAYLVLEYLQGESLADRLARCGPMNPTEVARVLLPIMGALCAAHERGIIHRDLKPENIYLTRDEQGDEVPKLLDFGIAKIEGGARATSTGQAIGTPAYMAMEQVTDAAIVDARADVWSLGVIWFEALAGRLPYEGATPMHILGQLMLRDPPTLSDVVPSMSADLSRVIARALTRQIGARWPSMTEFTAAIGRCFPDVLLPRPSVVPVPRHLSETPAERLRLPDSGVWNARSVGVVTTLGDALQPPRTSASVTLLDVGEEPEAVACAADVATTHAALDRSIPPSARRSRSVTLAIAAAVVLSAALVGVATRALLSLDEPRAALRVRVPLIPVHPHTGGARDAVSARDASLGDAPEMPTTVEHPRAPRVDRPGTRPSPARTAHSPSADLPAAPASAPSRIRVVGWK